MGISDALGKEAKVANATRAKDFAVVRLNTSPIEDQA